MRARVRSNLVTTKAHDQDATFTFPVWVGTIGGSALPTDPNPNTTPPAPGRILRMTAERSGTLVKITNTLKIIFAPIAGGNVTYQIWVFDSTPGVWIQWNGTTSLTPTGVGGNFGSTVVGEIGGADMFVQLTANVNVQAFCYDYG